MVHGLVEFETSEVQSVKWPEQALNPKDNHIEILDQKNIIIAVCQQHLLFDFSFLSKAPKTSPNEDVKEKGSHIKVMVFVLIPRSQ